MTKKYRLKIIYSEITEDNIETAAKLKEMGWDGYTCTSENGAYFDFQPDNEGQLPVNWNLTKLPKSWLTEIKEPLSFEEWYEKETGSLPSNVFDGPTHLKIWNAAIENDRLKTENWIELVKKEFIENLANNGTLPATIGSFIGTIKDIFEIIEGKEC